MSTEREVEVPWAIANAIAPVLDVGCAESSYLGDLPSPVHGIDSRPCTSEFVSKCWTTDIRTAPETIPNRYATVLAISTLEHVGLAHAPYQTTADDPKGDRHALEACVALCAPDGKVLMSVPYGVDEHRGWYRVYDDATLATLCEGFTWTADYHRNPAWAVGGVALVTVTA